MCKITAELFTIQFVSQYVVKVTSKKQSYKITKWQFTNLCYNYEHLGVL
jgi:hypothetical protein